MGVGGVLNVFRADEEMPLGFYARLAGEISAVGDTPHLK